MRFDLLRHFALEMKEREEVCVREECEDCLENFLAAPHSGQPVVDDGHPPRGRGQSAGIHGRDLPASAEAASDEEGAALSGDEASGYDESVFTQRSHM